MDRSGSIDKIQLVPQAEWIPPALDPAHIFEVDHFQSKAAKRLIGKTEVNISIEDEGVQTCVLPLFTKAEWKCMQKQRKYELIQYRCFRISLSPLFRLGRNCSAYVALIDNRFIKSKDGIIGSFVCPLDQGPVCVDILPSYTNNLNEPKSCWKLMIAVTGLDRKLEASYLSVKVSCMFRLHKFMDYQLYSSTVVETKFGSTESEGSIIQELRIPELMDIADDEPNIISHVTSMMNCLQQMSLNLGCCYVTSMFKPVIPALKTKCLRLQLLQPGNFLRVIKSGEHSEATEVQEPQTRE